MSDDKSHEFGDDMFDVLRRDGLFDRTSCLEAWKADIMGEVDRRLAQKEGSLWSRGRVEIQRLQDELRQVKGTVDTLQKLQNSFVAESQTMRGTLLDVTSKFELAMTELRELLRAKRLCRPNSQGDVDRILSPTLSVASTSASEDIQSRHRDEQRPVVRTPGGSSACTDVGSAERSLERSAERTSCNGSRRGQTVRWAHTKLPKVVDERSPSEPPSDEMLEPTPFVTAQRSVSSKEFAASVTSVQSPAVLSLARIFPSTSSPTSSGTAPGSVCDASDVLTLGPSPPSGKFLHLAACLDPGVGVASVATGDVGAGVTSRSLPTSVVQSVPTHGSDFKLGVGCDQSISVDTSVQQQFSIELVKETHLKTLGIEVNQVDGVSLCIEGIDEDGLIAAHNRRQQCDAIRICVGDRIIDVNGVRNDPSRMLQACKADQRLALVMNRGVALLPDPLAVVASDSRASAAPVFSVSQSKFASDAENSSKAGSVEMSASSPPTSDVLRESVASDMLGASWCEWQQGAEECHGHHPRKIARAPVLTRLRPEAREFVPASKKDTEAKSLSISLGLDDAVFCDTNDVVAQAESIVVTTASANSTESFVGGDEEVVRTLFK